MAREGERTRARLASFARRHGFGGRGAVALALAFTDRARREGLPLAVESLATASGGQVASLSGLRVQAILRRHGVTAVLAAEGGRTSPGNLRRARAYAAFLNALGPEADLPKVEAFWAARARAILAAPVRTSPLRLRLGRVRSIEATVADLLHQAANRERAGQGAQYAAAVLRHLVGAMLECVLGPGQVEHHGLSVAGAPGGQSADFLIGDAAFHVTTAPGERVIAGCRANLDAGLRPIIVAPPAAIAVAAGLAKNAGLAGRIDIFDAEQLLALHAYTRGRFTRRGRGATLARMIQHYNVIVAACEADPSLRIAVRRQAPRSGAEPRSR